MPRPALFLLALLVLILAFAVSLSVGQVILGPGALWQALAAPDPDDLDQFILATQRLPRALMAVQAGAAMAVAGAVLQGLTHNPLASPATLGVNAGAALALVVAALLLGLDPRVQGWAALAGAGLGYVLTRAVTRAVGLAGDPRGLGLILSGALVTMLLGGIAQALLLADPVRRSEFLGWLSGAINHAQAARFADMWWITLAALVLLWLMARPLNLVMLGADKAASAGVAAQKVSALALLAAAMAAGSAVAVSGPIAFLGLVVPHLARTLAGADLRRLLPLSAILGATLCLVADLIARRAFLPYVAHTGLVLEFLGGLVFIYIVYRRYLRPAGVPS